MNSPKLQKVLPLKLTAWVTILGALIFSNVVTATSINVNSGNFNVSYTDYRNPPPGYGLTVVRSYNSLSALNYSGLFGNGWSSQFETFVSVEGNDPKKGLVVHEGGGANAITFRPKDYSTKSLEGFVKEALEIAKNRGGTEKQIKDLEKSIRTNASTRAKVAVKYGLLAPDVDGTTLYSNANGVEKMDILDISETKSENTKAAFAVTKYIRYFGGKKQEFNSQGQLIKDYDTAGNYITFIINNNAQIEKVEDSGANTLSFKFTANGKVESIATSDGKQVRYQYDGNNNLIFSQDMDGVIYRHEYDKYGRMTKIIYADDTTKKIEYDTKPEKSWVTKFTDQAGNVTNYEYVIDEADPEHYKTLVSQNMSGKVSKSRYEYWWKKRSDATKYLHKIETEIDGAVKTTVNNECCGNPVMITQGDKITKFEYYPDGRLQKRIEPDGKILEVTYDENTGKIAKLVDGNRETDYKYDNEGKLVEAKNNLNTKIKIKYDRENRIHEMEDNYKRVLQIDYNPIGQPKEVALKGKNKILFEYSAAGELINISADNKNAKTAEEISDIFKLFIGVVKPEGINPVSVF